MTSTRITFSRRGALKLGGAALLGAALGCGRRPLVPAGPFGAERADAWIGELSTEIPRPGEVNVSDAFSLGVSSGDVSDDGAVLWTRHDGAERLLLAVYDDEEGEPGQGVASVPVAGRSDDDRGCFVHAVLGGVTPGARYHYCFLRLDPDGVPFSRSHVGRFQAGRAEDDDSPLLVGASACTKAGQDLRLIEDGSRAGADLWTLLGDTVYADGAEDIAGFRGAWQEGLSAPAYQRLRARVPVFATWDDHEVRNNFDPETTDAAVLRSARRAFFEHQPLAREPDDGDRIWRRRRFGKTLEVFVLDTRGERRPSTRETEEPIYISPAQMSWLKQGLRESEAVFKILVNSVPIADFPFPFEMADRWQGYARQRAELLSFIDDEGIRGALWLSGDIHMGCVGRVSKEGPGQGALEVIVGSTANFTNPLAAVFGAPQFDFATAENNTATLELHPATGEVVVRFFGRDGLLGERRYLR